MLIANIRSWRNDPILREIFLISCRSKELGETSFGAIIDTLLARIEKDETAFGLLAEMDTYLNINDKTSIASGSIFHRQMKEILSSRA